MKQVKIIIGKKSYTCDLLETEYEHKKGLMNVEYLSPDRGALFVWPNEDTRKMWMKDTHIPLDQIAINADDEVTMVYPAKPEDDTLVSFIGAKYILEVNQNSGIKVGDDFEIDDSDDPNKYIMKVIGSDGGTQFLLQGGERIVSRKETRVLIKKAKRAESVKDNEEAFNKACKSLGKYMFKVLYGQDHREAQYVSVPERKEKEEKSIEIEG